MQGEMEGGGGKRRSHKRKYESGSKNNPPMTNRGTNDLIMDPNEIQFGVLRVRDGEIVEVPLGKLEEEDIRSLTSLMMTNGEGSDKEKHGEKGKTREGGPEFHGMLTGLLNTVAIPTDGKGVTTAAASYKVSSGQTIEQSEDLSRRDDAERNYFHGFTLNQVRKKREEYMDDPFGAVSVYNKLKYDKMMARRKAETDMVSWRYVVESERSNRHKYQGFFFLQYHLHANSPKRIRAILYKFFKWRFPSSWNGKRIIDEFLLYLGFIVRNVPEEVTRFISDFGVVHTSSNDLKAGEVILLPFNSKIDEFPCFLPDGSMSGFAICESSLRMVENIPISTIYWARLAHKDKNLVIFS